MKRFSRISLVIVVVAVLLAVAVFFALHSLPDSELVRESVRSQINAVTGRKVTLESAGVTFALPGLVCLTLKGLTIEGEGGDKALVIRRIDLVPDLYDLVRRRFSIKSITLRGVATSVIRTSDGKIRAPIMALAAALEKGKTPPAETGTVRWSVREIRLYDGRIDWIDRALTPGEDVVVSVSDMSGLIDRIGPDSRSSLYLSGRIGSDKGGEDLFRLEGSVRTGPRNSGPEKVKISCFSDSIGLDPFRPYLPEPAQNAPKLPRFGFKAEMDWSMEHPRTIGMRAFLKLKWQGERKVDFEGRAVAAKDFSGLEEFHFQVQTDSLPLEAFGGLLPEKTAVDLASGVLRGEVRGEWSRATNWRAGGAVGVDGMIPTGKLTILGRVLHVWVRFQAEPDNLRVEGLDVSGQSRLISLAGTISRPFSEEPVIDLNVQGTLRPQWLSALDVKLPRALRITGAVPCRGTISGTADKARFRIRADARRTGIAFRPYVEKLPGKKAYLTIKGSWDRSAKGGTLPAALEAVADVRLDEVRLRLDPKTNPLPPLGMRWYARMSARGNSLRVRDSTLTLTQTGSKKELIAIAGSMLFNTKPTGSIEATLSSDVDTEISKFLGLELPPGVEAQGSVWARIRFYGRPAFLSWNLDLDLERLGVSKEKAFRKPLGVAGRVSARGIFFDGRPVLKTVQLGLPGLSLKAKAVKSGKQDPKEILTLETDPWDLAGAARYVEDPNLKASSGPVKARITLKRTESGIVTTGVIDVIDVDMVPKEAPWRLSNISGTIEVEGENAVIRELVGDISGACQGRWRMTGRLEKVTSPEERSGSFSLEMGKGKIKAVKLVRILTDHHSLLGRLIRPRPIGMEGDFMLLDSVRGDFTLRSTKATTENLRSVGPGLFSGIVGTLDLESLDLDLYIGNNTVVVGSDTLSRIPGVRRLITGDGNSLIKLRVDTYAHLTGSVVKGINIIPLDADSMDPELLARLKKMMK